MQQYTPVLRKDLKKYYEEAFEERKALLLKQTTENISQTIWSNAKEGVFNWEKPLEDCVSDIIAGGINIYLMSKKKDGYISPIKKEIHCCIDELLDILKQKFPDSNMSVKDGIFYFDAS